LGEAKKDNERLLQLPKKISELVLLNLEKSYGNVFPELKDAREAKEEAARQEAEKAKEIASLKEQLKLSQAKYDSLVHAAEDMPAELVINTRPPAERGVFILIKNAVVALSIKNPSIILPERILQVQVAYENLSEAIRTIIPSNEFTIQSWTQPTRDYLRNVREALIDAASK
jgi:uncharacterized protein (DUF342 family)